MDPDLQLFLRHLLQQLPSLLALLGCLIFCLASAKRHPKVSLIAAFGLFYLLMHGVFFAAVYVWVPIWWLADRSPADSHTFWLVLRIIYNVTLGLGFGLLLAAIFMRRSPTLLRA